MKEKLANARAELDMTMAEQEQIIQQLAEARAEIERLRQELRDNSTLAARQIVPAEMLVDDLAAEIERKDKLIEQMRGALTKCKAVFETYVTLHSDKLHVAAIMTEDECGSIREKIARNQAMVDICEAALCHEQWAGWMEYLFLKSKQVDGCVIIPAWAVDRWRRQVATRYSDLSEDEKNSDRNEADRFLSLFNAEIARKDKLIEQMREALSKISVKTYDNRATMNDICKIADAALSAAERGEG